MTDRSGTAQSLTRSSESCASTLQKFSDAWNRADVDALMELMSDDPTYRSSTGPGPGAVYRGAEEVRAAFTRMLGTWPAATGIGPPPASKPVFFDNRAVSFWSLKGTAPDGAPALVEGVDILTFDTAGRISVKDAYRKAWPS